MKRYIWMALTSLLPVLGFGQTTLGPGDLVILAINGDTDAMYGRGFSFMPLVNLEEGTEVFFTDYGWSDVSGCFITSTAISDVFIKYTVPSGGLAAGTVIRSSTLSTTNFAFYFAYGVSTFNYLNLVGTTVSDEVLVFQGSITNPTFICAATYLPTGWATDVTTNGVSTGSGSALPGTGNATVADLIDDATALSFNQASTTNDNSSYTGPTTAATKAEWQARVTNYANWTFNDAVPIPAPPIGPFVVSGTVVAPTVASVAAASIAATSATLGGEVTADGGAAVSDRGVVVSLSSANTDPRIGGTGVTKVSIGNGTGSFSQEVGSLTPDTSYHFNAYAINSAGTNYGSVRSFTTLMSTRVALYDFYLREEGGQIRACWQTASEERTVGFDLFRWQEGAWVKVNGAMIPATGEMGGQYGVADSLANATDTFRYKLVELESDGGVQEYGPFDVAASNPRLNNLEATADGVVLRWLSREQDTYEVQKSTGLQGGFVSLATGLPATPPVNVFTDRAAPGEATYYRIRVE